MSVPTNLPVEYFINTCNTTATLQECQYNYNMAHCNFDYYQSWGDIFYCIDPNYWAFLGLAGALGLSIAGAAW